MSGRPGPWCMAMAYANSPVEFGHAGSHRIPVNATMEAVECLHSRPLFRPVGWSGDGGGGVRERNKVELTKSGDGSRRGRSPLLPS